MQRTIPALCALLLVQGCASQRPVFTESFVTSINNTNMRQFVYEVTFDNSGDAEDAGPRRDTERRRRDSGARDMPRKVRMNTEKAILERLDTLVIETAFCDKGYFVYRKEMNPGVAQIFGECKSG